MDLRFPESEICQWAEKYQEDNLSLREYVGEAAHCETKWS